MKEIPYCPWPSQRYCQTCGGKIHHITSEYQLLCYEPHRGHLKLTVCEMCCRIYKEMHKHEVLTIPD